MLKKQITLKSPETRLLITTIGIAFVIYIFSQRFIVRPQREKLSKLKASLEHINLQNEIARLYKEVKSSEKSLPPQKDPSWLLTQITILTQQSRLDIESIEPLPVKQLPSYSFVPYKVKTTCTFGKLLNFIELIESSSYILNIESLMIKSKGVYKPELPKEELDKEAEAIVEMIIGTIY